MFGEKFVRWQEQTLQLGMQQGMRMMALGMYGAGMSIDTIVKVSGQDEATIRQWIAESEAQKSAGERPDGEV